MTTPGDLSLLIMTVLAAALFGGCIGSMFNGFGRSNSDSIIGGIFGAVLLGGSVAGVLIHGEYRDQREREMRQAEEIDADEYHVVSLWRRSDCQLDALAGRAMADGMIGRGEYDALERIASRLQKEAARTEAGGTSTSRTCSVIPKTEASNLAKPVR